MRHENDAYGYMTSLRLRRDCGEFGIPLTPEQKANLSLQQADINEVHRRYLEDYWEEHKLKPIYLQQMGRARRPKPSRRDIIEAVIGWTVAIGFGFALGVIVGRVFG